MLSRPAYTAPNPGNPQPAPEVNPIAARRAAMLNQSLLNYQSPVAPPTDANNPYGITSHDARGVAYQSVDPNELVGTRLNMLLASDSEYMRAARAAGQQQAASRGLLNSSIAGGTSENAAIQAGLPIAQGEAQQYSAVGAANQGASNQQLLGQTAADAQVASAGLSAGAQLSAAQINALTQQRGQDLNFQTAGQQLGYNYAQLAQQGSQYNSTLAQQAEQFNASQAQQASQFDKSYNQNIGMFEANQSWQQYSLGYQQSQIQQQTFVQGINSIMMNENMTPAQRSAAISNWHDVMMGWQSQAATIPAWTPPYVNNPGYWG